MATVTSVGSGNYNTGSTWDSGARPGSSDDVIIASGHTVTLVQAENANSLDLQSGGTLDGDGNLLTIDGENSSGYAVKLDGAISGTDTDITITTPAATNIDLKATSGNVRNVTINHASCAAAIAGGFMTITGNLTITAGSLNTGGNDLTVGGDVSVTGTLTGNASAISLGSLTIASGGTYSATSGTTTLTKDDTSQFLYETISGATFTNNDGTVLITGDGKLKPRAGTGNFHNLEINASGNTIDQSIALTCEGNLTITAGTLDTDSSNNYALTVAGTTSVTGTLTCNASTVSLGSGKSDDYALTGGGTVNFGTGTNTVGAVNTTSASGITKTSGTITFDTTKTGGQSIGPNVTNNNTHYNFGTSTVNFDLSGGFGSLFAIEQHLGSSKTFTITAATVNYKSNGRIYQNNADTNIFKIIGDLVIDASKTLTTYLDNADDFGSKLEVTGDVTLNGTLNAYSASNPKPMDFGSLTIGGSGTYNATSGTTTITSKASSNFAFKNEGTFTHNSGTMQIGDGSTSTGGAHLMNTTYHNLIINRDQNAPDGNTPWRPSSGTEVTIAGDLTVTKGRFYRNSSSNSLVVTGDVDIAANGQVGTEAASGSNTFGSIVIAGTYLATSGTTTITNEKSGHAWKNNGGTFTHNNGKVLVDFDTGNLAGDTEVKENTFYDLEVKLDSAAYELRLEDHSSTNAMDILNNLTVTKGIFDTKTKSDTLTLHGQTIIESDGVFTEADHDTNKIIHNGIVRNSGTYKINDGTTVKMNAGIRNLGTITVA